MAKRRFNKYAHKQYMQSRLPPKPKPSDEDSVEMVVPDVCDDEPDNSEVSDPLDGTPALDELGAGIDEEATGDDEAAAAVKALQMDFGDWAVSEWTYQWIVIIFLSTRTKAAAV